MARNDSASSQPAGPVPARRCTELDCLPPRFPYKPAAHPNGLRKSAVRFPIRVIWRSQPSRDWSHLASLGIDLEAATGLERGCSRRFCARRNGSCWPAGRIPDWQRSSCSAQRSVYKCLWPHRPRLSRFHRTGNPHRTTRTIPGAEPQYEDFIRAGRQDTRCYGIAAGQIFSGAWIR